ncbi:DUF4279 domain-containing protein [Flavobacterium sp. RHBU_3]|uniref:DUF4279 domain-containing protein n=1 Tax=Flavobacterium sp. RHBU_3 TaxID=3391184 RepID=UPI0039855EDA
MDTTGYVYFAAKTENESIDLEWFNLRLSLLPTRFSKMFERGKTPVCTSWDYSSAKLINPIFGEEIDRLIAVLAQHKEEFLKLKTENPEICFVLEVVIYHGEETPGLSFSKEVLDFVHAVGAEIDCDIYNYK